MNSAGDATIPVLICHLTCPVCGEVHAQTMPTDACIYFFECTGCGTVLRPKPSDCCVFCSYGSSKCPPVQQQHGCCESAVMGRIEA